jgi:sulfide dehydrogenase cytochrome subunit
MDRTLLRTRGISCFFALVWLLPAGLANAEDPTINRLLASQCAQCHGTNGYSVGGIDELAGEDFKDLYEDLADMQGEDRPEDIMDHQALGYSDDQIRRIARYYAGLPEEQRNASGTDSGRDEREDEDDD